MTARRETPESPPMDAGRELDAEIAVRVMGWTRDVYGGTGKYRQMGIFRPGTSSVGYIVDWHWQPSTRIADAWLIVEAMEKRGLWCRVKSPYEPGGVYWAGFTPHLTSGWNGRMDFEASAPTAPLAISRAALSSCSPSDDTRTP